MEEDSGLSLVTTDQMLNEKREKLPKQKQKKRAAIVNKLL